MNRTLKKFLRLLGLDSSETPMTREERDAGLDATGQDAIDYYNRAMAEADEILRQGVQRYYRTGRGGK